MTPQAKDFMSKNPPKKRELNKKLLELSDDIHYLLERGYTHAEILRYLQEYHNLKVSRPTLARQIAHTKSATQKAAEEIIESLQKEEIKNEPN